MPLLGECEGRVFTRYARFSNLENSRKTFIKNVTEAILDRRKELLNIRCERYSQSFCLIGKELVSWLNKEGYASTRLEGLAICSDLVDAGFIYEYHFTDGHFQDDGSYWKLVEDIPSSNISLWSLVNHCSKAGFLTIPAGKFWSSWSQYVAVVPSQKKLFHFEDDNALKHIFDCDLTNCTVSHYKYLAHSFVLEDTATADIKFYQTINCDSYASWITSFINAGAIFIEEPSNAVISVAVIHELHDGEIQDIDLCTSEYRSVIIPLPTMTW